MNIWAILYLLCIPLFAAIYTLPIFEFHHSTLPIEKSVTSRKSQIDKLIIDRLIESELYRFVGKDPSFSFHQLSSTYDIHGINYVFASNAKAANIGSVYDFKIHFCVLPFSSEGVLTSSKEHRNVVSYILTCKDEEKSNLVDKPELHKYQTTISYGDNQTRWLNINGGRQMSISALGKQGTLVRLITEYRDGVNGSSDSFGWTERFSRMFYFSAVTITTLGYGDITAVNNSARTLVAAQSILGIVLMGLYLSVISRGNRFLNRQR